MQFKLIQLVPDDLNSYRVLPRGLECLALLQEATCCGNLIEHRRLETLESLSGGLNLEALLIRLNQRTRWELQLELLHQGWKDSQKTSKRRLDPVTTENFQTDEKVYYFDNQQLAKEYLVCLLLLEHLFQAGLKEFYHFQLNSYYCLLIDLLQNRPENLASAKPHQVSAYYKELMVRNHNKKRKPTQQRDTAVSPDESDVDQPILSVDPKPTSAELKFKHRRGRGGRRGRGTGRQKQRSQPQSPQSIESKASCPDDDSDMDALRLSSQHTELPPEDISPPPSCEYSLLHGQPASSSRAADHRPPDEAVSPACEPPPATSAAAAASSSSSSRPEAPAPALERTKATAIVTQEKTKEHPARCSIPKLPKRLDQPGAVVSRTTLWSENTIWAGSVPLILRSDQGGVVWIEIKITFSLRVFFMFHVVVVCVSQHFRK